MKQPEVELKNGLLKLFALLMLGVIISSMIQLKLLGNQTQIDVIESTPLTYFLSIGIFQICAFLIPSLIWLTHIGLRVSHTNAQTTVKNVVAASLLFVVLYFVANLLNQYIERTVEIYFPQLFDSIVQQLTTYQTLFRNENALGYSIIVIGVIPAIAEELFFRAGLFRFLELKLGSFWHAALLSSLFFAGVHMQLTQLIPIFILGMGLAVAYKYTGSIWVPIVLHMVNNVVQILLIIN